MKIQNEEQLVNEIYRRIQELKRKKWTVEIKSISLGGNYRFMLSNKHLCYQPNFGGCHGSGKGFDTLFGFRVKWNYKKLDFIRINVKPNRIKFEYVKANNLIDYMNVIDGKGGKSLFQEYYYKQLREEVQKAKFNYAAYAFQSDKKDAQKMATFSLQMLKKRG